MVDGFYDVYTISSSPLAQGKIPSMSDLQQISITDDVNYEVILVNCTTDYELHRLEQKAYAVSSESRSSDHGLIFSGLIQKIADIVVDRMGGPVGDADDMTRKWAARRNDLRCLLNTIILPLGQLDFGLSRHRALLFKVAAFFLSSNPVYYCNLCACFLFNAEKNPNFIDAAYIKIPFITFPLFVF